MSVPFFGVETGLRALRTAQAALDTASHNIANANTPGYSRQRVEFQQTEPYTLPSQWRQIGALQIGTGVAARAITQARDAALDTQLRGAYGDQGAMTAKQRALSEVEEAVGEPGPNGISAALARLFNSFQDLSVNPESTAARHAVTASAAGVTGVFRRIAGRLDDTEAGLQTRVQTGVAEVNDIARQIAQINTQIRKVLVQGDQPNDLRDQRNMLLDRLAKKANITTVANPDGTMSVAIGGTFVVQATEDAPLAGIADLTANGDLTGGELRGYLDAQAEVRAFAADLDGLANAFLTEVNTLHQNGLDKNGASGVALFTGANARDLTINPIVAADPDRVAAASNTLPFAVGNGENALVLAGLATRALTSGPLNNESLRDFWGGAASRLAVRVQSLDGDAESQDAFVRQFQSRREAISGVSLDDEMADLVKFQRAYQAAARIISMADELTGDLIASFGGRG